VFVLLSLASVVGRHPAQDVGEAGAAGLFLLRPPRIL